MPPEPSLSHRNVPNANVPYISNVIPTVTDPCYAPGSQNLLASIAGGVERRPGFADSVVPTPTTFHNLVRTFTWDRLDGTFLVVFCNINASNQSEVYKMNRPRRIKDLAYGSGMPRPKPVDSGGARFRLERGTPFLRGGSSCLRHRSLKLSRSTVRPARPLRFRVQQPQA
jgi:hypothetical protein